MFIPPSSSLVLASLPFHSQRAANHPHTPDRPNSDPAAQWLKKDTTVDGTIYFTNPVQANALILVVELRALLVLVHTPSEDIVAAERKAMQDMSVSVRASACVRAYVCAKGKLLLFCLQRRTARTFGTKTYNSVPGSSSPPSYPSAGSGPWMAEDSWRRLSAKVDTMLSTERWAEPLLLLKPGPSSRVATCRRIAALSSSSSVVARPTTTRSEIKKARQKADHNPAIACVFVWSGSGGQQSIETTLLCLVCCRHHHRHE